MRARSSCSAVSRASTSAIRSCAASSRATTASRSRSWRSAFDRDSFDSSRNVVSCAESSTHRNVGLVALGRPLRDLRVGSPRRFASELELVAQRRELGARVLELRVPALGAGVGELEGVLVRRLGGRPADDRTRSRPRRSRRHRASAATSASIGVGASGISTTSRKSFAVCSGSSPDSTPSSSSSTRMRPMVSPVSGSRRRCSAGDVAVRQRRPVMSPPARLAPRRRMPPRTRRSSRSRALPARRVLRGVSRGTRTGRPRPRRDDASCARSPARVRVPPRSRAPLRVRADSLRNPSSRRRSSRRQSGRRRSGAIRVDMTRSRRRGLREEIRVPVLHRLIIGRFGSGLRSGPAEPDRHGGLRARRASGVAIEGSWGCGGWRVLT